MGGWLAAEGQIVKYFARPVTTDDLRIFGIEKDSCSGQQLLEALAILIALRLWHTQTDKRVRVSVRGDNVGALSLVMKMRPSSAPLAIIAREIALLTMKDAFPPKVTHTHRGWLMSWPTCFPASTTQRGRTQPKPSRIQHCLRQRNPSALRAPGHGTPRWKTLRRRASGQKGAKLRRPFIGKCQVYTQQTLQQ